MRPTTILEGGKFCHGWHFDSRADFLANKLRLPQNLWEEYEKKYPPPPPPVSMAFPVILLKITCLTGLLSGEVHYHHFLPPAACTQTMAELPGKGKMARTPIEASKWGEEDGVEDWREITVDELFVCAKGVLERCYEGKMIGLEEWVAFRIGEERVSFPSFFFSCSGY
jgi:hypothetical protein